MHLTKSDLVQVSIAHEILKKELKENVNIEILALRVFLSTKKLRYAFKFMYDTTVSGYHTQARMDFAKDQLMQGKRIKEIYPDVGYRDPKSFSRAFKRLHKREPSHFKFINDSTTTGKG